LTVTFTRPVVLEMLGVTGNQVAFQFQAQAGAAYEVEHRLRVDQGAWAPLTNIEAQPFPHLVRVTDMLQPGSRFYRVRTD
jgi:hypothetical protein